ncbi:MAG: hypothetical protein AVDCRST_MAG20-848, partial [uncultured Acidimicrobiales bacterium]
CTGPAAGTRWRRCRCSCCSPRPGRRPGPAGRTWTARPWVRCWPRRAPGTGSSSPGSWRPRRCGATGSRLRRTRRSARPTRSPCSRRCRAGPAA